MKDKDLHRLMMIASGVLGRRLLPRDRAVIRGWLSESLHPEDIETVLVENSKGDRDIRFLNYFNRPMSNVSPRPEEYPNPEPPKSVSFKWSDIIDSLDELHPERVQEFDDILRPGICVAKEDGRLVISFPTRHMAETAEAILRTVDSPSIPLTLVNEEGS